MSNLIDPDDSVLVIIDVQVDFLARVEDETKAGLLERIAFLAESARSCDIPIIASVESPEDWGGLHPELVAAVGDAPVLRKEVFGLCGDPLVGPAVRDCCRSNTSEVLSGTSPIRMKIRCSASMTRKPGVSRAKFSALPRKSNPPCRSAKPIILMTRRWRWPLK